MMPKNTSKGHTSPAKFNLTGGIHPAEHKQESNESPIRSIAPAEYFILPVPDDQLQAIATMEHNNQPLVKGQRICESKVTPFSSLVHSPCDGLIEQSGKFDLGHKSGELLPAVKIKNISPNRETYATQPSDFGALNPLKHLTKQQLIEKIHQAGIVGLGGAAFPTHVKLLSAGSSTHTLIVNAMECEPYITCDDRLLREDAMSVVLGAYITASIVGAKTILFGIEDNKPVAIEQLENAINSFMSDSSQIAHQITMRIIIAKTKYPSGGEKQLIQLLTGKQVPKGKFPSSLGIVVQNVATLHAVYLAITKNQTMTHRLVTITGNLVQQAGNYWIAFGTPVSHIAQQLNVDTKPLSCFVFGGPLMGERLTNLEIPTKKSTNCIIFDSAISTLEYPATHKECIRCAECESACPVDLLPQQLYWFAKSEQWDSLEHQDLFSCIECAACSYVCPSEIPLVSYYQYAKSEIKDLKLKQQKSELAKLRYDNREQRIARLKAEREEKRKQAAETRKLAASNKANDPDGKKSAIAAALLRVKNKKENNS